MTNKFVSVMEAIGRDALRALNVVEKYLPKAEELAMLLFPAQMAVLTPVLSVTNLILKAVVLAEQKMAAGGQATGTGLQKSSDVLSTVEPTVLQVLSEAGISTTDTGYVQKIIDAVVADLNVRDSTVAAASA
jgi:hypothetical protein